MKEPDWLVQPLFPPTRRVPPKALTSGRPPLAPPALPEKPRRVPRPSLPRQPLPRSPFHP